MGGFRTTDKKTSNDLIVNQPCRLKGAFVITDGSNTATLTIYDNTTNSGKISRQVIIPGSQRYGGFHYRDGILMENGIYCTISGTGGAYWIDWSIYG